MTNATTNLRRILDATDLITQAAADRRKSKSHHDNIVSTRKLLIANLCKARTDADNPNLFNNDKSPHDART